MASKLPLLAAADRDHLPQPVLPRLQQRDRARADARPGPFARASSAGRAAPSSSRCSRCRSRSACGSTATAPGARWRRCRCSPWSARLWIAAAADAADLIAGARRGRRGLRRLLHVGRCSCARAGFAPARLATALSWVFAASNIGTLAAATPLAWIAATVGWRNGFLGLAAVTRGGGRCLLRRRARPAARPAGAARPGGRASARSSGVCWKCGPRPACCRCSPCTSSPTPPC